MLRKLSQLEKEKYHNDFTHLWNLKNNINEQTNQKQTHRYRAHTDGCQRGGRLEEGVKKVKGL